MGTCGYFQYFLGCDFADFQPLLQLTLLNLMLPRPQNPNCFPKIVGNERWHKLEFFKKSSKKYAFATVIMFIMNQFSTFLTWIKTSHIRDPLVEWNCKGTFSYGIKPTNKASLAIIIKMPKHILEILEKKEVRQESYFSFSNT